MPVTCQLIGDLTDWTAWHSSLGRTFEDRAEAIAWGIEELDHDDFRIATLVDGDLAAIGFDMDDFDPVEENLHSIAMQLGLRLADGPELPRCVGS